MADPRPIRVVVLAGDGIGPEVCRPALALLERACADGGRRVETVEALIGGAAWDAAGSPFPDATRAALQGADAVLLGAVGGPKWDTLAPGDRPERGLLELRRALGVYANLRPVRARAAVIDAAPLKREIVEGTDMLVVRELLGDVYFGTPRGVDTGPDGLRRAYNTMVYDENEIRRVARRGFELARARRRRLTSVDKANVLEVSRLWREVVADEAKRYPDVALDHQYVDSLAMDLVRKPRSFDVVLAPNLFGDILTDEAAVIAGSIGLLPSASLGDGAGMYEPIHGSAPDIAGRGIANPIGTIASVGEMLRWSLGMPDAARRIDAAIDLALADGARTADLGGTTSTDEMGERIARAFEKTR